MVASLPKANRLFGPNSWIWLVIFYGFLVSSYFVFRYQGLWTDTDTAALTRAINAVKDEGTIYPHTYIYGTGFTYQTLVVFLSDFSGLSVQTLQTFVLPFLSGMLGSTLVFLVFREYLGNNAYAALGTILLYAHPDFLYVSLRGSHEKLTWPLAAATVFCLLQSLKYLDNLPKLVCFVFLFYVCVHALISTNFFFGSSFVLALLTSFVIGFVLVLLLKKDPANKVYLATIKRYLYVIATSTIILAIVLLYTYPSVVGTVNSLRGLYEKTAAIFLSYQGTHDSYSIITYGWVNNTVYIFLTLLTYIIAITSFATLLTILLRRRIESKSQLVLIIFYIAFSIQFLAGAVADLTGQLGANLQLRLIPAFLLSAIPLTLTGLKMVLASRHFWLRRLVTVSLPLLLALFCFSAIIKATNDPIFSNYWGFYKNDELLGMTWGNQHLDSQSIWLDYDAIRLETLWDGLTKIENHNNSATSGVQPFATQNFMLSDISQRWGARQRVPLPMPPDAYLVYDNGDVKIYHAKPLTPYQE